MIKTIEVVYEDNVFKPVGSVDGFKEHERMIAIISQPNVKKELRELAGTMTHNEAREMQIFIDEEFGKIEGDCRGLAAG